MPYTIMSWMAPRVVNGVLSFPDRPRLFLDSDDEEEEMMCSDSDSEDLPIISWDKHARPPRGILKKTASVDVMKNGVITNGNSQEPRRRVKFSLSVEQEQVADRPYRESYQEAKLAKRQAECEPVDQRDKRKHAVINAVFKRKQRSVDTEYLQKWKGVLAQEFPNCSEFKTTQVDPRTYKDSRNYFADSVHMESHSSDADPEIFAHKFRRLIFAPAKLTP